MANILAIGSHFDDVEIGCGGTLLKHKANGDDINIVVLNADDNLCGPAEARMDEQFKSLDILQASLTCFNSKHEDNYIVGRLDEQKADVLYFPHSHDYHQDHARAHRIGMAVGRKTRIDMMAYLAPTSHSYYPNLFSSIELAEKKALVSCFTGQMERRPDYMMTMTAQNRFFGTLIEEFAAEGFIFHRMILKL